jgi:DNA repair protein RadA/Sms
MAKPQRSTFVCQSCGAVAARWAGKCASCGEWNTIAEEAEAAPPSGAGLSKAARGRPLTLATLAGDKTEAPRFLSGMAELDRVTGGGIVPGSVLLIAGEPGIGKSTLLLQLAATLATRGRRAIYFSGEEAVAQVRLRAARLGLVHAPVALAAETSLADILATLAAEKHVDLVVVDSIQTLWSDAFEAASGTVSQVRAATQALVRYAKAHGTALLLVGHVTKDGQIAGPKVIEHMVDTVLSFEGDRGHTFRILRAAKNRFGATDEIGVFEMAGEGLREVANPSELFLGDRDARAPGTAVFAGIEGTRPILVEVQALVAPSGFGVPRRAVVGWDASRLAMLIAVLEARCGISFASHDVYLNIAGGLKIAEPAADLAAAAALLASARNRVLSPERIFFGEISLSGAVRTSPHMALRLKEAKKLGFTQAVIPKAGDAGTPRNGLGLTRIAHLKELAEELGACD